MQYAFFPGQPAPLSKSAVAAVPALLLLLLALMQLLTLSMHPLRAESWLTSHARAVADEEAQLGGSSIALMQNLIPAVAVLLLGFVCRQGMHGHANPAYSRG